MTLTTCHACRPRDKTIFTPPPVGVVEGLWLACLFVGLSASISPELHFRSSPNFFLCVLSIWPWLGTPLAALQYVMYFRFYRAMLCIRGTSHGPVSVCLFVSVCVCHKSEFY